MIKGSTNQENNYKTYIYLTIQHKVLMGDFNSSLLLGRKVMTNLDNIFKSRDITLPTKVHLVEAMLFMEYGLTGSSVHGIL